MGCHIPAEAVGGAAVIVIRAERRCRPLIAPNSGQNGGVSDIQHDTRTDIREDVREDVREELSNENGDHERFAHYVKARRRDAEALVLEARIHGKTVTALCGKKWVPSRDPQRFPICPTCAELAKGMRGSA